MAVGTPRFQGSTSGGLVSAFTPAINTVSPAEGETVFIAIGVRQNGARTPVLPSGWTLVQSINSGATTATHVHQMIMRRVWPAGGTAPSITITGGTAQVAAGVTAIPGNVDVNRIAFLSQTGSSATPGTGATQTRIEEPCLYLNFITYAAGTPNIIPNANFTEGYEADNTDATSPVSEFLQYRVDPPLGLHALPSCTTSPSTSARWISVRIPVYSLDFPIWRSTTNSGVGSVSTRNMVKPDTGFATDDIIVAELYKENTGAITAGPAAAGWQFVGRITNTNGPNTIDVWIKRATSTDVSANWVGNADYSVSWASAAWSQILTSAYRNVPNTIAIADLARAFTGQFSTVAGTTLTVPSCTPDYTFTRLIIFEGNFSTTANYANPAVVTERLDTGQNVCTADYPMTPAAASGAFNVTIPSGHWVSSVFALRGPQSAAAGGAVLAGSSAGTSTAGATTITESHPLAGASDGVSTAGATRITESHPLAASSAGTSTAGATALTAEHPLDGSSVGTSTAGATSIQVGHPLGASSAGTSTASASSLTVGHPLGASSAGTSTAGATAIRVGHPLAASSAGTSTVAGDLTVGAAGAALAGSSAGTSTVSATTVSLSHPLAASAAGTSTAGATRISLSHPLSATSSGVSTAAGTTVRLSHPLAALAAGTSSVNGELAEVGGRLQRMHNYYRQRVLA